MKPEEQARQKIDDLLTQAGWAVQDRDRFNLRASRGVAIREFSLSTGAADYLLFVDTDAVGTVEAKKVGETLIGVEEQSAKYRMGLPGIRRARGQRDRPRRLLGQHQQQTTELCPAYQVVAQD